MRVTGDPITAAMGGRLTPDQLAQRIHEAGYDRPLLVQYLEYLGQVFTGNFGRTLTDNRAVTEVLLTYGAATLELALNALVIALLVGIPFGLLAARFPRDKWPDAVLRVAAILFYATPVFFAGLLLKLVFGVGLGWLPIAGRAGIEQTRTGAGQPRRPHRHLLAGRPPLRQLGGLGDGDGPLGAAGGRAGPAHRRRFPPSGPHQRDRHPRQGIRGGRDAPAACPNTGCSPSTPSNPR